MGSMLDDGAHSAKNRLHDDLRRIRDVMVWKLAGLDEYDARPHARDSECSPMFPADCMDGRCAG